MEFKLDENLPKAATGLFTQAGHDALSVLDQKLGGHADESIGSICRAEGRVIVTLDLDFADVRNFPPCDYSGIIVVRPARENEKQKGERQKGAEVALAIKSRESTPDPFVRPPF
jgi:hypothetical protein